jgi:hypothetical protein
MGKPDRKRPRLRKDDNIKINLKMMGCGCMEWIVLAQVRDW